MDRSITHARTTYDDECDPLERFAGDGLSHVAVGDAARVGHVQPPQEKAGVPGQHAKKEQYDAANQPAQLGEGVGKTHNSCAYQIGEDDEDAIHPSGLPGLVPQGRGGPVSIFLCRSLQRLE